MAKSKSTNLLQQQSDLNSRFGMQPVNFGDISLLQIIENLYRTYLIKIHLYRI